MRFTDEELKHQELFRRLEQMAAAGMPPGYSFKPQPNDVASAVLEQIDVGRARPDARYRAIHASALSIEHRARFQPFGTVARRVPVSLEGRIAARNHGRAGMAARARASDGLERDQGVRI